MEQPEMTDRTRTLLSRAAFNPYGTFGSFRYHPDGDAAGATPADTAKPDEKAGDKGKAGDSKPEAKYTDADIERARKEAVADAERKAADKARKDAEAAERQKALDEGKTKDLLDKSEAKARELEAENRRLRVNATLADHIAAEHKDYVGCAKYIAPLIPADVEGEALTTAVKQAVADYVKDNPRQVRHAGGAPPAGRVTIPPANLRPHARTTRPAQPSVAGSRF